MGQGQDWGLPPSPSAANLPILLVTIATDKSLEDLSVPFPLQPPGPFVMCPFACHRPWDTARVSCQCPGGGRPTDYPWARANDQWQAGGAGRAVARASGKSEPEMVLSRSASLLALCGPLLCPEFRFMFSTQHGVSSFSQCCSNICSRTKPPFLAFRFLHELASTCLSALFPLPFPGSPWAVPLWRATHGLQKMLLQLTSAHALCYQPPHVCTCSVLPASRYLSLSSRM